jgi:hypothetical protein
MPTVHQRYFGMARRAAIERKSAGCISKRLNFCANFIKYKMFYGEKNQYFSPDNMQL